MTIKTRHKMTTNAVIPFFVLHTVGSQGSGAHFIIIRP